MNVSARLAAYAAGPFTAGRAPLDEARAILTRSAALSERADAFVRELRAALSSGAPILLETFATGVTLAGDTALLSSAATVAPLLALRRHRSIPEDRIAEALAVGREVASRLARSVASDDFTAHWNLDAVAGIFGAVTAAAHALALDAAQTQHAVGVAATQAAALAITRGTPDGRIALGKAAADGLEAAMLARHGFTSAAASIEGRRGFAALSASRFDPAVLAL